MKNNSSTQNGLSFTTSWSHDLSTIFLFLIFSTFLLLPFKSQIQKYFSSYKLNFSFPSLQNKRSSYSKWYADFEPWKLPDPISEGFKLSESIEPKFRPFRWGPEYQVTMGIRSLDPTQWITLHSSYPSYIRLREARHSVHKSDSYRILPSNPSSVEPSDYSRNYLAALETARCVSAFLATRYPKMFQVEPKGSHLTDDGWGIKKITRSEIGEKEIETGNKLERKSWNLLDENEVLFDDDGSRIVGDNPIKTAGELIPDDLAVLLPDPVKSEEESKQTTKDRGISEEYRLIAGSICTAGFWRLKDKIGRTLREIHLNGKVPQYETRLEFPMNKFFSKLAPNKPVERNNYFFQILSTQDPLGSVSALQDGSLIPDILNHQDPESSPISGLNTMSTSISSKKDHTQGDVRDEEVKDLTELSWSHSTNGPETLFDQGTKAPKISSQENGDEDGNDELIDFKAPEPTKEKSAIVMRTERQTLRRLRRSGAIIFTIRTYIVPVTTMAEERGIPGRLASAIRSWSQDVRAYKGGELYEDVLLPYLDEKHQQQLKDGLIEGEETEREKSRKSYPL